MPLRACVRASVRVCCRFRILACEPVNENAVACVPSAAQIEECVCVRIMRWSVRMQTTMPTITTRNFRARIKVFAPCKRGHTSTCAHTMSIYFNYGTQTAVFAGAMPLPLI